MWTPGRFSRRHTLFEILCLVRLFLPYRESSSASLDSLLGSSFNHRCCTSTWIGLSNIVLLDLYTCGHRIHVLIQYCEKQSHELLGNFQDDMLYLKFFVWSSFSFQIRNFPRFLCPLPQFLSSLWCWPLCIISIISFCIDWSCWSLGSVPSLKASTIVSWFGYRVGWFFQS